MEARARRNDQTSQHKANAKKTSVRRERVRAASQLAADQQSSFRASVCSSLRRVVTWLKQSALFSWLHHIVATVKQSIMGNQSWSTVLIQIGLWLLLLWLLSNLHMGLPCFLLALVFWLHNAYGGGPPLSPAISWRSEGTETFSSSPG